MENPYILYLEDDELEIHKFRLAFDSLGSNYKLKSCNNGEEGLLFLNQNRHHLPSFILLDLNMPIMNGFEFLEEVKSNASYKKIPIVIFSSSNNQSDIIYSYDLQVAGYFVKPFNPEDYKKVIEKINHYWEQCEL
ncbi:putative methanoproteinis regulatory protein FilR2 [Flavobacteriaceae bacterium UJ101]|nr:putative methanoproteinis regulatory protein FilR2 [Flavobacteriaceae bacterium UJ101]